MRTPEAEKAEAAILEFLEFARTAPRKRWQGEAPVEKTVRLLKLEAAWALARVGTRDEAVRLRNEGAPEFDADKRVEAAVADLFRARIIEALDGGKVERMEVPGGLEPYERYQVRKVHNASQVLSPTTVTSPEVEFTFGRTNSVAANVHPEPRRVMTSSDATKYLATLGSDHHPSRLTKDLRAALRALAPEGLAPLLAVVESVKSSCWSTLTDSFNSNVYWCLTVIGVFDAVVFAIAEAIQPLQRAD